MPHGGARRGAGRKPSQDRKVKRSVALSPAADALVIAAMRPGETYSQTVDRLLLTLPHATQPDALTVLIDTLTADPQPVATIYRKLQWTRKHFEQVINAHRGQLHEAGVRLHVATKDAASGRQERYVTVDGTRYAALSRPGKPRKG